jgi:hypothetical protein
MPPTWFDYIVARLPSRLGLLALVGVAGFCVAWVLVFVSMGETLNMFGENPDPALIWDILGWTGIGLVVGGWLLLAAAVVKRWPWLRRLYKGRNLPSARWGREQRRRPAFV